MKILLIYPYFLETRVHTPEDVRAVPLGVYYVASVLKENQYDVEILGLVFQKIAQACINLSGLDDVIVIQDHDQIAGVLGDVIDQTDRQGFGAAQLECTDDLARICPYLLVNGLNSGDQVRPEPDRVVVTRIKGKPRCGLITLGKPACHHGGFAESRWRRDQGQLAP